MTKLRQSVRFESKELVDEYKQNKEYQQKLEIIFQNQENKSVEKYPRSPKKKSATKIQTQVPKTVDTFHEPSFRKKMKVVDRLKQSDNFSKLSFYKRKSVLRNMRYIDEGSNEDALQYDTLN